MARDVASRVSGDDEVAALELSERAERAAARFDSIHSRWSGVKSSACAPEAGSTEGTSSQSASSEMLASGAPAHVVDTAIEGDATSDLGPGSVRITPILGIATEERAAPRPRLKTLMGVPRDNPELDELAGLDVGHYHDTVRLERPGLWAPAAEPSVREIAPPAAEPPATPARPDSRDEPSLAATSWPWERNGLAPNQSPRVGPSHRSARAASSLDVSSELAALRPSARRSWWLGLGGISAIAVLLVVGAPRERGLALHWLREAYHSRVQPLLEARTGQDVADSTRALHPTAAPASDVTPVGSSALGEAPNIGARSSDVATAVGTSSIPPESGSAAGAAPRAEEAPAIAPPPALLPRQQAPLGITAGALANDEIEHTMAIAAEQSKDAHSKKNSPAKAAPAGAKPVGAAAPARSAASKRTETTPTSTKTSPARATTPAQRESRNTTGGTAKARVRVAAARKPSPEPVAPSANVTKPRATRQNPPRKDSGAGIIRETPF
jgi:hypothetical protein